MNRMTDLAKRPRGNYGKASEQPKTPGSEALDGEPSVSAKATRSRTTPNRENHGGADRWRTHIAGNRIA